MNQSKRNDPRSWERWEHSGAVAHYVYLVVGVIERVDYSKMAVTASYKCAKCGASGCKLWREYQCNSPSLLCCDCAAKDQKTNIRSMGADGRYEGTYGKTDQIGWYVPCVPDEEEVGYWGYTSVPETGCIWWRRLPNRPGMAIAA
jgi:hypothetical protein